MPAAYLQTCIKVHVYFQIQKGSGLSTSFLFLQPNIYFVQDTRQELEEEKCARLAIKDKLSTTEYQLRQARVRVSKMDRQLREAEASISSLTGTVKTLEEQVLPE